MCVVNGKKNNNNNKTVHAELQRTNQHDSDQMLDIFIFFLNQRHFQKWDMLLKGPQKLFKA